MCLEIKMKGWESFYTPEQRAVFEQLDEVYTTKVDKALPHLVQTCPRLIAAAANAIMDKTTTEEQLIVLYSVTAMAGVIAPQAFVNYDNKVHYLTLNVIIVFPPAFGKGILAKLEVVRLINQELIRKDNQRQKEYREKLKQYHQSRRRAEEPLKPPVEIIQIPGDITGPRLIQILAEIDGKHIVLIKETEIDAFGIAANSAFGAMISAVTRNAFHHEPISKMIKAGQESYYVSTPKLTMILAGTEDQLRNIFHGNANGLFSRFLVVTGDPKVEWKNTQPCIHCPTLDEYYNRLAEKYYDAWLYMKDRPIEIIFTEKQWMAIQQFGEHYLHYCNNFVGAAATSLSKRHALMVTRIAGIFSILRYYEAKSDANTILCTNQDFSNALWLTEMSLLNAIRMFRKLPAEQAAVKNGDQTLKLLAGLPEEFFHETIKAMSAALSISERTISRRINELTQGGYLERIKPGHYRKTGLAKKLSVAAAEVSKNR